MGRYHQEPINGQNDVAVLVEDVPGQAIAGDGAEYTVVGTGSVWITIGTYQVHLNVGQSGFDIELSTARVPDDLTKIEELHFDDAMDYLDDRELIDLGKQIAAAYAQVQGE